VVGGRSCSADIAAFGPPMGGGRACYSDAMVNWLPQWIVLLVATAGGDEGATAPALLREGEPERIMKTLELDSLEQLPHYDVVLALSDVEGRYKGIESLRFTNTTDRALDELILALQHEGGDEDDAAGGGSMDLQTLACVEGPACSWSLDDAMTASVELARPLQPMETVVIESRFEGRLCQLPRSVNNALAMSQEERHLGQEQLCGAGFGLLGMGEGLLIIATPHPLLVTIGTSEQEENVAVPGERYASWFLPAVFNTRVLTPTGLLVVTNLADSDPVAVRPGVTMTRAKGAGTRRLVVAASRTWVHKQREVGGVLVRSWYLPWDARAGEAALDATATALTLFSDIMGPYPFRELDIVEASLDGTVDGVSFPGLVLIAGKFYRERTVSRATDPARVFEQRTPEQDEKLVELLNHIHRRIVVHEIAHAWVGVLVDTTDSVSGEALAEYLATRHTEHTRGTEAWSEDWRQEARGGYLDYRLSGGEDGAAARDRSSFSSGKEYKALVYNKASHFYLALEQHYGRERLDQALGATVQQLAWNVVDRQTLVAALERNGLPLAGSLARRWWEEAHGDEDLGLTEDELGTWTKPTAAQRQPPAVQERGWLHRVGLAVSVLFRDLLG